MSQSILIGIVIVIIAGIGAQWLAWRFKWPSIVLLLAIGFMAGPVTRIINPDQILGDLLLPLVSISVAIILFEGGLGLRIYELRRIGNIVFNLVFFGALITWALIALLAHYLLGLSLTISILLGSILVVTGPTVIIPLLRHVRPSGGVGSILKWEGIIIDPIGAAFAVLAFEYILIGQNLNAIGAGIFFLKSILIGSIVGIVGACLILLLLRKYWIPDYLHGTVTLVTILSVFVAANLFHHESGLFAVIAMGMVLGNQRKIEVQHIISFKENLGILIISMLFIVLAARLNLQDLSLLNWKFFAFLGALILLVRPIAVFISTFKSGLELREKLFISWMAPRGIVAAAIASIFAFRLSDKGIAQAEYLVPIVFLVIIATVIIYGLSSSWVARKLGLSKGTPQGVLILGAHLAGRLIAKRLHDEGIKVSLIDTNAVNVDLARKEGLTVYQESILDQDIEENVDFDGIGRLMALTSNDAANSLAVLHFRDILGRSEIYQLCARSKAESFNQTMPPSLCGRFLFNEYLNYESLINRLNDRNKLKVLRLTEDMDQKTFHANFGQDAVVLFVVNSDKELRIMTAEERLSARKGESIIFLLP